MEASWPLALPQKSTRQETKDQTIPGFGGKFGEGEIGVQRCGGTYNGEKTQGPTGTRAQAEVGKRRGTQSQELRKTQAHSAGHRDKRRSLAVGRCRRRLNGWRFTPVEYLGSGCK